MIKTAKQKPVLFTITIVQAIKVHLHILFIFLAIAETAFGWSYDISGVDENNQSNSLGLYSIYPSEDMDKLLSQLSYDIEINDLTSADFVLATLLEDYSDNPELPDEILNIAARCSIENKHEYAIKLCTQLVYFLPQTSQSRFAMQQMAIEYSELGDEEKARHVIENLKNDNKKISHKAELFYRLGRYYSEKKNMDDYGAELYEYAASNCPKDDYAMLSQVELIKFYIRTGDPNKSSVQYSKLISEFAENQRLASNVCFIADTYLRAGETDVANLLYTNVLNTWPNNPQTIFAKAGFAKITAQNGQDKEANRIVDEIFANYADNPEIASAIFGVAEHYWNMAWLEDFKNREADNSQTDHSVRDSCFRNARDIWEKIINTFTESSITPESTYFLAEVYNNLGQNQLAINTYQKVVDTWPDFKYAENAQYNVIKIYKKFRTRGPMPESEAMKAILKCYVNMIDKFPESSSAARAKRQLVHYWRNTNTGKRFVDMSAQEIVSLYNEQFNQGESK